MLLYKYVRLLCFLLIEAVALVSSTSVENGGKGDRKKPKKKKGWLQLLQHLLWLRGGCAQYQIYSAAASKCLCVYIHYLTHNVAHNNKELRLTLLLFPSASSFFYKKERRGYGTKERTTAPVTHPFESSCFYSGRQVNHEEEEGRQSTNDDYDDDDDDDGQNTTIGKGWRCVVPPLLFLVPFRRNIWHFQVNWCVVALLVVVAQCLYTSGWEYRDTLKS